MKAVIYILALSFLSILGCSGEEMEGFIKTQKNEMQCQVYFFKSWATYSHPVKPVDAMDYTESIKRGKFYRAWMCDTKESHSLFTLFEGIELSGFDPQLIPKAAEVNFYSAMRNQQGEPVKGKKITPEDSIYEQDYFFAYIQNGEEQIQYVKQAVKLRYEYVYKDSGALDKVIITNALGEKNTLKYR